MKVPLDLVRFRPNVSFHPTELPKGRGAPVAFQISARIDDRHTGHPPALRELEIQSDKNFAFDLSGLPTCRAPIRELDSEEVKRACAGAILGEGEIAFHYSYPENSPIPFISPLTLVKRDSATGAPRLLAHAYSEIAKPTAIVSTVELGRIARGIYRSEARVRIPEIGDGYGTITSFRLKIPRRITYEDKTINPAKLSCPNRRIVTRFTGSFDDEVQRYATTYRPCVPTVPR